MSQAGRHSDSGVPEYWVVDAAERVGWVWSFETLAFARERVDESLVWNPVGATEPLTIDMDGLFRPM